MCRRWAAAAVLVPFLATRGRPADKPLTDRVSEGTRYRKLTAELVRRALTSLQMAAINFFKSPRFGKPGGNALINYKQGQGLRAGLPSMIPVFSPSNPGAVNGLSFSVLSGRF